jgi:CHAD domain-containing protein
MKRSQILQLLSGQYRFFLENYHKASLKGEALYIHQFRVAVKRMLGLKGFLIYASDPDGGLILDNMINPIRPVYKSGGKVRNLQVVTDVSVSSFSQRIPKGFMNYLKEVLHQKTTGFLTLSASYPMPDIKKFNRSARFFLDQYYSEIEVHFHLNANRVYALQLLQGNAPGDEWHDARAHIKRNYLLLQMAEPLNAAEYNEDQMLLYRRMEQILGHWHDLVMLEKIAQKYELELQDQPNEWASFKKELTDHQLLYENDVRQNVLLLESF